MHSFTNKLINETSPYLLQHAHNPVNWYPWGEEALNKALEEDKPILVSIGYAACHWCHVMEKESFEDETTAALMNEYFINIKIDREERPDLDHIYMDAVQAMAGNGGWPLNVFLTPGKKPFYGGTYFPPVKVQNRSSWKDVLTNVAQAYKERKNEIEAQAENLTGHLLKSNSFGLNTSEEVVFAKQNCDEAFENILKAADKEWGGFGRAPKFPQTFTIQFLLRYSYYTKNKQALQQAVLSLDKMIEGGIYDQLGGGFSRYSTDTEWLAPHFEKMLYDNALLIIVLSEAYQLTKKERYKEVIQETIAFVQRELMHSSNGFYAALDADSEGEEGKFYVWDKREIDELLGEDARLFNEYYDVTNHGNWEGNTILRVLKPIDIFTQENNLDKEEFLKLLEKGKEKLFAARNKRVRPALDDKILLGWNALMNTAVSKAWAATGVEEYRQLAVANMQFLFDNLSNKNGGFYHTWKNGQAKFPAFIDDYAFLIQALVELSEITMDTQWLIKAKGLSEYVIASFSEEGGFFYYTEESQQDIIVRKKEVYDGATPSGNAVMAYNLHRLSILFDQPAWRQRSYAMAASLSKVISKYPTSFGVWNCLVMEIVTGTNEIAIVGKEAESYLRELLAGFLPHKVVMASFLEEKSFPLMNGKQYAEPALVYLCKDFNCLQPVSSVPALMSLIDRGSILK